MLLHLHLYKLPSNTIKYILKTGFLRRNVIRRQPTSTTVNTRPHLKCRKIQHVDVPAWLRRLRIAPSRTSPISTIHSQIHAFAWFAVHNHPTWRAFISAAQAGTSYLRIYLAVTDPSIKPISGISRVRLAPRSSLPP